MNQFVHTALNYNVDLLGYRVTAIPYFVNRRHFEANEEYNSFHKIYSVNQSQKEDILELRKLHQKLALAILYSGLNWE